MTEQQTDLKPVEDMTVDELRDELKERGFPTSGSKADRQVHLKAAREAQSDKDPEDDVIEGEVTDDDEGEHLPPAGMGEQLREAEGLALELREKAPAAQHAIPGSGEFNAILAVAAQLAHSQIVPGSFRGKPDDIVAAILMGRELGIGPMQSLKDIAVIDGRPALAAHLQLALLRKGGVQIMESDVNDERAFIVARRSDTGEIARVEWTFEEAEKITRKGKSLTAGDNWRNYRRDMLWARCVGRLTRRLGSDLVAGMPYTAEEVADFDDSGDYGGPAAYDTPTYRQNAAGREPGAPKTRAELLERFAQVFGDSREERCRDTAAEFIKEALQVEYNVDALSELAGKANEAFVKIASAVMYLEDTTPDLALATDVRETVTKAFAAKLPSGPALHGPPWRLGPDEPGLPDYWTVTGKQPPAAPAGVAAAEGAPGAGARAASPQEADEAALAGTPQDAPLGPEDDSITFGA